jgi:hypothetical protein
LSKNEKRMVFIELARVSEIPAPQKFDRSTLNSIDLLFDRSTLKSIDHIFQHFRKSSFSMYFCLENCHFTLIALQKRKNTKTNQNIRK